MKKLKRFISILLSVLMLASILSAAPFTTAAADMGIAATGNASFKFTDGLSWGSIYAYFWNEYGDDLSSPWPGDLCYLYEINDNGETVYDVFVPNDATGCIISNGNGAQTTEITDFNVKGYYINGYTNGYGHYVAFPWPDGDYQYRILSNNTAEITGYTGDASEIEIPSTIDGYNVTSIGDAAFEYADIVSVVIPDSITSIGKDAFYYCDSLESIKIPDSVTSVGSYAFQRCYSLKNVKIGRGITSISYHMFSSCTNLEKITIPSNIQTIDTYAFDGCTSLATVLLHEGVKQINEHAFDTCISLESIKIPSSVQSIYSCAFVDCGLKDVKIPSNVEYIGNKAFGYDYNNFIESYEKIAGFVVSGYSGTAAEKYAYENGFTFFNLDDYATPDVTWIVAGESGLCGSSWDPTDAENALILDGYGIYSKTYEKVPAGKYSFKVTNGTWDETYGNGNENFVFNVVEECDVTIYFNVYTNEITVVGDDVEIPSGLDIDYIVAVGDNKGDPSFLNGISWNQAAEENKMATKDGKVFTITYEGVTAYAGYQVKFAANGAWTDNWGTADNVEEGVAVYNGDNIYFDVDYDLADVTLTLDLTNFDYATKEGATYTIEVVEVSKVPEYTDPVVTDFPEWPEVTSPTERPSETRPTTHSRPLVTDVVPADAETNTFYFYMPKEWRNELNDAYDGVSLDSCKAGIYWWNGTGSCEDVENQNGTGKGWPGHVIPDTDPADSNIFVVNVPTDVYTIIFNNTVDGGSDSNSPDYVKSIQTENVSTEFYSPADKNGVTEDGYGFYPDGTGSFNGMIYVCNPKAISKNEFSGKETYRGVWFYYYGNGRYGINKEPVAGEIYSNGEFPKYGDNAGEDTEATTESNINKLGIVTTLNNAYPTQTEVTGKTVTVTYNLTAPELISDGQGTVTYDNTKLKLVSMELPKITSMLTKKIDVTPNTAKFNFTDFNPETKLGVFDFTKGGAFVVLTFEVLDNVGGLASVDLTIEELDSANTIYFELGAPKFPQAASVLSSLAAPSVTSSGITTPEPTDSEETIPVHGSAIITNNGTAYNATIGSSFIYRVYITTPEIAENGQFYITYPQNLIKVNNYSIPNTPGHMIYYGDYLTDEIRFNFSNTTGSDLTSEKLLIEIKFDVIGEGYGSIAFYPEIVSNLSDQPILAQTKFRESIENADVFIPTESAAPTYPTEPGTPDVTPTIPGYPTEPTEPTTPDVTPTIPGYPTEPTEPTTPDVTPTTPHYPTDPTEPGATAPSTPAPTWPSTTAPTVTEPSGPNVTNPSTPRPTQPTNKPTVKKIQKITVPKSSYTKTYGNKAFSLKAKTNGNGKLTYTSSNKKVVKVSSKGKVTIKGSGKATITVRASETSTYRSAITKITIKVKPGQVKITSGNTSPKKLTVKFKKQKNCSGYETQLSEYENFRQPVKKTYSSSKKSLTVSVPQAKKFYYLRIRAYKKIGGKKLYGKWTKIPFIT